MLTQQDMTLIVAALQFWGDEMDPQDTHLLKLYSSEPEADQTWMLAEIQQLRSQLKSAHLKYAVSNNLETALRTTDLFSNPEAAHQAKTIATDQIGTLLLPDPTLEI